MKKQLAVENMPAFFRNLRRSMLTAAGESLNYNWSDEFKVRNLRDMMEKFDEYVIDFSQVPHELAVEYFTLWDKEDGVETYLIPLYMYSLFKPGQTLVSLSGNKVIVGSDYKVSGTEGYIDCDHRQGNLAYGITYNIVTLTLKA